jgi:hypothetical protein
VMSAIAAFIPPVAAIVGNRGEAPKPRRTRHRW